MKMAIVNSGLKGLITQQTRNICIPFVHCWTSVGDVGPKLYKCYTKVLCLLGSWTFIKNRRKKCMTANFVKQDLKMAIKTKLWHLEFGVYTHVFVPNEFIEIIYNEIGALFDRFFKMTANLLVGILKLPYNLNYMALRDLIWWSHPCFLTRVIH